MNNKVALLKISKSVKTKLELAKYVSIVYIDLKEIKLSDTDLTVLSYFMVYGINNETKNLIIKSEICKNINVIKGVMTKLKKNNLIYKDDLNSKNYVCDDLKFTITPTVGIYIKLDTDNNEH